MFQLQLHIKHLEVDKIELRKKEQEVKVADDLLSEVLLKYNKLSSELEDKKRVILKQAKIEAKEILQNASCQIENTISQIKEANANKEKTKKIREEFSKEQIHIDRELSELEKQEKKNVANKDISNKSKDIGVKIDLSPIAIGDIVKIGDENTFAEVVSIKRNRLEVISNSVKMSIEKNKVIKVDKKSFLKSNAKLYSQKQSAFLSVIDELNEKRKTFKTQLDLRGERAEDALDKLSQFIDQARLLGEREISVLHGKGDGILKTIIRDYLKTNSEIKSFTSARIEFGGEGITMITLN
jgi:DNA mismatch repair protein MutS2